MTKKEGSVAKCKGCRYYYWFEYLGDKKVHTCKRFRDSDGYVFLTATEAYKLGCKGKYKKL